MVLLRLVSITCRKGAKNIYAKQWTILAGLAKRQCDPLDGVTDGIITNDNCTIPDAAYATVQCGQSGVDANNCLTAAQINTAKKVYSNYVVNGTLVYPGPVPGSEADFASSLTQGLPSGFDQQWEKYALYNNPSWTWQNFSDQVFYDSARIDPGHATADQFDVSQFRSRGARSFSTTAWPMASFPPKGRTCTTTARGPPWAPAPTCRTGSATSRYPGCITAGALMPA